MLEYNFRAGVFSFTILMRRFHSKGLQSTFVSLYIVSLWVNDIAVTVDVMS